MIDLLTPEAVAARLHVSTRTLANWRTAGQGPPYLHVGGVRYPADELELWLARLPVRNRREDEEGEV